MYCTASQGAFGAALSNPYLAFLMIVYTVVAYLAITCHMTMVKEFGGITTVIIGNTRKALTIILSFVLFPKPGSWLYILGGILVFGSLTANAYLKEKESAKRMALKVLQKTVEVEPNSKDEATSRLLSNAMNDTSRDTSDIVMEGGQYSSSAPYEESGRSLTSVAAAGIDIEVAPSSVGGGNGGAWKRTNTTSPTNTRDRKSSV